MVPPFFLPLFGTVKRPSPQPQERAAIYKHFLKQKNNAINPHSNAKNWHFLWMFVPPCYKREVQRLKIQDFRIHFLSFFLWQKNQLQPAFLCDFLAFCHVIWTPLIEYGGSGVLRPRIFTQLLGFHVYQSTVPEYHNQLWPSISVLLGGPRCFPVAPWPQVIGANPGIASAGPATLRTAYLARSIAGLCYSLFICLILANSSPPHSLSIYRHNQVNKESPCSNYPRPSLPVLAS